MLTTPGLSAIPEVIREPFGDLSPGPETGFGEINGDVLEVDFWTGTSSGLHRNLTETGAYGANGRRNSQVRISGQRLIGKPRRCRGGTLPPGFEDHTVCSDPFRKFSILSDSSRASQICVLTRSDWIRRVLSIELSRFYHGKNDATGL